MQLSYQNKEMNMKKVTFPQLPLISNSGSIYSLSGIKRLCTVLNRVKITLPAAKRVDDPGHGCKTTATQENKPENEQQRL